MDMIKITFNVMAFFLPSHGKFVRIEKRNKKKTISSKKFVRRHMSMVDMCPPWT
jgi:hypothetical protein